MIYITKITKHKYNTSVVWDKIRNWGLKRKSKSRNKQGEKTTRRRKHNIYHKEKKDMEIHANIFTQAHTYTILLSTENNNSYLERNNAPCVCVCGGITQQLAKRQCDDMFWAARAQQTVKKFPTVEVGTKILIRKILNGGARVCVRVLVCLFWLARTFLPDPERIRVRTTTESSRCLCIRSTGHKTLKNYIYTYTYIHIYINLYIKYI